MRGMKDWSDPDNNFGWTPNSDASLYGQFKVGLGPGDA
jgi:hypothetical protein